MKSYTFFLDESGDHGLKNIDPAFPIFVLSGVLINDADYPALCKDMEDLKLKHFGSKDVILHSSEIRKCEGAFQVLFDLGKKQEFYQDLNDYLTSGKFMIIASAIRKEKHVAAYGRLANDPYAISLTFVLERCLFQTDGDGNKVQVVIESRGKKEDAQLAQHYNTLLGRGGQVEAKRLSDRFASQMIPKPKRDNDCGLQIADLCAYPLARHLLSPGAPYPTYDVIKGKIRRGAKGIEGYGLKIFP